MKIAVVATAWFPLSHADVIVSRWVQPYPGDDGRGWLPDSEIGSVYLEQRSDRDIGVRFCAKNQLPIFDSVAQALTLGGDSLAVDAVLLIGEHGDYPRNEFGQKLYPRRRLFDEIVKVFRSSGRSVPVFNDKHFSWDFTESGDMLRLAGELGFPLYGGSSLTHCPIAPGCPVHAGESVKEALSLFHGDPDSYGYHSLEFLQAFVERRAGGETGIRAVRAWSGEACRRAIAREIPEDLFAEALARHGYPRDATVIPGLLARVEDPWLFQLEHHDGFKAHHVLLPKFVSQWVVAVRAGDGPLRSAVLNGDGGAAAFFANFARLNARVQEFFRTKKFPSPPLRTHLVAGALQACLQAAREPGRRHETPHLDFAYHP
jgi:hypothetical protein